MTASAATGTFEQALAHAARLLERDPALAEQQAREILHAVDGHPAALHLLAAARAAQGDARGALDILEPLAQAQPTWAPAHFDLGLVRARLGEAAGAVAALRHALELAPDLPQGWRLLGDQLYAIGLARLFDIGDTEAVSELADTITLSALAQADDAGELAEAVWRAGGRAVGWGSTPEHRRAKELARAGSPEALAAMRTSAEGAAAAR